MNGDSDSFTTVFQEHDLIIHPYDKAASEQEVKGLVTQRLWESACNGYDV
jgi:hypothetical protein